MEYIYVNFREARDVLVDGTSCGATNDTIGVQRGNHTITLDGQPNYAPPSRTVTVINTTFQKPLRLTFN